MQPPGRMKRAGLSSMGALMSIGKSSKYFLFSCNQDAKHLSKISAEALWPTDGAVSAGIDHGSQTRVGRRHRDHDEHQVDPLNTSVRSGVQWTACSADFHSTEIKNMTSPCQV